MIVIDKPVSSRLSEPHIKKVLPNDGMPPKEKFSPSRTAGLSVLGIAFGFVGLNISTEIANAANRPDYEKAVVKSSHDAYNSFKSWSSESPGKEFPVKTWLKLEVAMMVGDNTLIGDLIPIRQKIIQEGATNPNIPPWVIHTALYTTAIHAQELPKQFKKNKKEIEDLTKKSGSLAEGNEKTKIQGKINSLKEENRVLEIQKENLLEMVKTIIPHLGNKWVDVTTVGDLNKIIRRRHIIPTSEVLGFKKNNPTASIYEVGSNSPTAELGAFVIAKILSMSKDTKTIDEFGETLLSTNNPGVESALWPVCFYLENGTKIPDGVLEKARVNVFGHEQLDAHRKHLKEPKGKTPPIPGKIEPKTIPGVPEKTKVGSLEGLPKELQSPLMPYHLNKTPEEQESIARTALMTSRQDDEFGLVAASQWFAHKHFSEGIKTSSFASGFSRADYIMLQTIAEEAAKETDQSELAFEVLGKVLASFPGFGIDTVLGNGRSELRNIPLRYTHEAVAAALMANSEEAKELIRGIAEKNPKAAPLVWNMPTSKEEIQTVNEIRSKGQGFALKAMAYLFEPEVFRGHLLRVVRNPFMDDGIERSTALAGLALGEECSKETLTGFLDTGLDEVKNSDIRRDALYAFLKATSKDPIQREIGKRFSDKIGPLTFRNSRYYPLEGEKITTPFLAYPMKRYEKAIKDHKLRSDYEARQGRQPLTLREDYKLRMLLDNEDDEFSGPSMIPDLMCEKGIKEKYIPQMIDYLKNCKGTEKILDTDIAIPIIRILGKSKAKEAQEVLRDIAVYPEQYVKEPYRGSHGVRVMAGTVILISSIVTQVLGETVDLADPNDPAAKIIHTQAEKGGYLYFESPALRALTELGIRYEEKIKALPDGPEKDNLDKARAAHSEKIFNHMRIRKLGPWSDTKYDHWMMYQENLYADVAIKVGGRHGIRKLLGQIDNKIVERNKHTKKDELKIPRDTFIRSWTDRLFANGYNPKRDNPVLGFMGDANTRLTKVYEYMTNAEYVNGSVPINPRAGEGMQTLLLDWGLPSPGVLKRVDYLFDHLTRPEEFIHQHPAMVGSIIENLAPGISFLAANVDRDFPEDPFRPPHHEESVARILEEVTQGNISGAYSAQTANASFSYYASGWHNQNKREMYFNALAAHIDQLGLVGLKAFNVAAGNHHTGGRNYPLTYHPELGESNILGLYSDGKPAGPLSRISALDFLPDEGPFVADFSSIGNPLRENKALAMTGFQGVRARIKEVVNGKIESVSGNGTSFATPWKTGTDIQILSERKDLTPFTLKAYYEPYIKLIPDRSEFDGGAYPDLHRLREDLYSKQKQQIQDQKALQKK